MIILYITLWLLAGFVGNYIGWRVIDNRSYDMKLRLIISATLLGAITFVLAIAGCLMLKVPYSKFLNTTVFKRK